LDKDWYRKAFAEDYLWLYSHRSEKEARSQVKVARKLLPFKPGQKIIDIACGAGRHMLPFARAGARMTGIDLSKPLLTIARQRFRDEGMKAVVRCGDMRELSYRAKFDGATIWFTSIGYFPTVSEDQKVINGLAAALKPEGWWWIDLPNPVYLEAYLVRFSERVRHGPNGKAKIAEKRRISGGRVRKTMIISDSAGTRRYEESVRLYRPEKFGNLVRKAGLTTDGILGDYDGSPLTIDAPRQIWYGRKAR